MGDGFLLLRRVFRQRARIARWTEDRVVAEAALAPRRLQDHACALAATGHALAVGARQRGHAHEAGCPRGARSLRQGAEQRPHAARVVEAGAAEARRQLRPLRLPDPGENGEKIGENRAAVLAHFSREQYGARLMDIYQQLMDSPVEPLDSLPGEAVLDQFLAPERLYLLRS